MDAVVACYKLQRQYQQTAGEGWLAAWRMCCGGMAARVPCIRAGQSIKQIFSTKFSTDKNLTVMASGGMDEVLIRALKFHSTETPFDK